MENGEWRMAKCGQPTAGRSTVRSMTQQHFPTQSARITDRAKFHQLTGMGRRKAEGEKQGERKTRDLWGSRRVQYSTVLILCARWNRREKFLLIAAAAES